MATASLLAQYSPHELERRRRALYGLRPSQAGGFQQVDMRLQNPWLQGRSPAPRPSQPRAYSAPAPMSLDQLDAAQQATAQQAAAPPVDPRALPPRSAPPLTESQFNVPTVRPQNFGERMEGLNDAFQSPLFQTGMSLLGRAQNGGDWAGVGEDLRSINSARQEQLRANNEERRFDAQERRARMLEDRQTGDWNREDARRGRVGEWAQRQTNNPFASVDPDAAFEAAGNAYTTATEPITPAQQEQFALTRRGQNLDYSLGNRRYENEEWEPSRIEATTMQNANAAAATANEALLQLNRFEALLDGGMWTGYGVEQWGVGSAELGEARQLEATLELFSAPQGQGAISGAERDLIARTTPQTQLTRAQNYARIHNARTIANIRVARAAFTADYGERVGNLRNVENEFQASPSYTNIVDAHRESGAGGAGSGASGASGASAGSGAGDAAGTTALPDAATRPEGEVMENPDTGEEVVNRNGRWVPLAAPAPLRSTYHGSLK